MINVAQANHIPQENNGTVPLPMIMKQKLRPSPMQNASVDAKFNTKKNGHIWHVIL